MTDYAPVTAHEITESEALRLLVLDSEYVWQDNDGRWWRAIDAAYGRALHKREDKWIDPKTDLWTDATPPHPGTPENFYLENDGYKGKAVYKRERNWAHEQQTSKRHIQKNRDGIIDADPLNVSYDGGQTWEAVPSAIDVDMSTVDPFFEEEWDGNEEAYWAEYNEGAIDAEVISVTEPEVTEFVATEYREIDPTPEQFFEQEPDYEHPDEKGERVWGQWGAFATGRTDPVQEMVALMDARLNEPFERWGEQIEMVQAQMSAIIGQKRTQRQENLILVMGVLMLVCVAWARLINPLISWIAPPNNQSRQATNSVSSLVCKPPVTGLPETSGFGTRKDPFTGVPKFHAGQDWGGALGTPVKATAAGVVDYAGAAEGYGNLVVVKHANNTETYYGHLNAIAVKKGQHVELDTVIGTLGSTGRSTAPHLHFGVKVGGEWVDPLKWLKDCGNGK